MLPVPETVSLALRRAQFKLAVRNWPAANPLAGRQCPCSLADAHWQLETALNGGTQWQAASDHQDVPALPFQLEDHYL